MRWPPVGSLQCINPLRGMQVNCYDSHRASITEVGAVGSSCSLTGFALRGGVQFSPDMCGEIQTPCVIDVSTIRFSSKKKNLIGPGNVMKAMIFSTFGALNVHLDKVGVASAEAGAT